jgi:hypothetical protein
MSCYALETINGKRKRITVIDGKEKDCCAEAMGRAGTNLILGISRQLAFDNEIHPSTIIAASPGYYLLAPVFKNDERSRAKAPVVGWLRRTKEEAPFGITATILWSIPVVASLYNSIFDSDEQWAVQFPDGLVVQEDGTLLHRP